MHGWRTWLSDLQQLLVHGDDAVLVTVAHTEGAAPREVGVKMVVARDRTFHTIGGGALEWRAIELARRLLREGTHPVSHGSAFKPAGVHSTHSTHSPQSTYGIQPTLSSTRRLERISLGEFGDAPPGAATVAFERLTIADLAWVTLLGKRFAAGDISVRTVSFADDSPVLLSEALPNATHADCLLWDAGPMMTETLLREAFPVMVFGAGHVGSALVRVLASLPCDILWVDDRPAQWTARTGDALPANVATITSDDPPSCVDQAPDGCSFVVMTYSDTLDQHIVESVLQRNRFDYLGVIGSYTKRHSLEQMLHARGIPPAQLSRLHCPIGLPGMPGSAPEIIAVSIAAQLLQHRTLVRQAPADVQGDLTDSGAYPYSSQPIGQRTNQYPSQHPMQHMGESTAHAGHPTDSVHPVSTRLPDGTTVTTITTVTTSAPPAAPVATAYPAPVYAAPSRPGAATPQGASRPEQAPASTDHADYSDYSDWTPQ